MQVASLGLKSPTEIQKAVIPEIMAGRNLVMASHTGSGKTLAFLLPLVSVYKLARYKIVFCMHLFPCNACQSPLSERRGAALPRI